MIIKKTRRWTSYCFVSNFGCFSGKPVISSVEKVLQEEDSWEQEKDIIITWIKVFNSVPFFKQYQT